MRLVAPTIQCTLLTDGASDRSLLRIIEWLIRCYLHHQEATFTILHANFSLAKVRPRDLSERIALAIQYYPCDLLFIHRDAENQDPQLREAEIAAAVASSSLDVRHVKIIPVRMTEAWLLIDEKAIRMAADNPNGKVAITLPSPHRIEEVPDPKEQLQQLLVVASEKSGRRRDQFRRDLNRRMQRIPLYIADYSPLRQLRAFQALEQETRNAMAELLAVRGATMSEES